MKNIEQVIDQLWDVRCSRVEDEDEIRDIAFLALNTIKRMKEELEQKDARIRKTETALEHLSVPENFVYQNNIVKHVTDVAIEALRKEQPDDILERLRRM